MGSQARAGAAPWSGERFWDGFGVPKGIPKRDKFEALSVTKWGRDFGAIWGSILERLWVRKREV